MSWGNATNVTTNHLSSSSDDPSQARVELYNALIELTAVINGRNTANGVCGLDANGLVSNSRLPNTLISAVTQDLTLDPATGRVNIQDVVNLAAKTVSELETLAGQAGDIAYCSDGDAGQPCLAVSLGETDSAGDNIWYRVALSTQISAT